MAHERGLPYNEYIPLTKQFHGITSDGEWQR